MARTWLSIRVDLVEGRGERFWPRPGRVFAAARRHTFAQLAEAIDDAFARWDRAHLHDFTLADGTWLTTPYVRLGGGRAGFRRPHDDARRAAARGAVRLRLRLRRRLDAPLHGRQRAHRPARRAGHSP